MTAERQTSVAYTDRERIEQFLVYLPEVSVRDFAYQISIFPNYYKDFATAYSEYKRNIQESVAFAFTDSRTQEAFVAFNTAIDALYVFSLACLSKLHPGDDLLDEIYHPENESEIVPPDDPKEMMDELNALANLFLKTYASLLGVAIGGVKKQEAAEKNGYAVAAITRGKTRFTLPTFQRTEWGNLSIQVAHDGRAVVISARYLDEFGKVIKVDRRPYTFQDLGCSDGRDEHNERPDDAWEFLIEIAHGGGFTLTRSKEERKTFKKQKQRMTDILRRMFRNDTDPLEAMDGGVYRAKFAIEHLRPDNTIVAGANTKFLDIDEVFGEMTAPIDEKDGEFSQ